ncbi:hypothetical protein GGR58DRAFT_217276 [Xylaria digitata]|nr:hypothetical protein GGR58DRAFT_217276 [Xylaria digitata]
MCVQESVAGSFLPPIDSSHRETPVHVTNQVARTFDAEKPPNNGQRAVQPSGNGGSNQESGNGGGNHSSGNGNENGGNGGRGDRGGRSGSLLDVRNRTTGGKTYPSGNWRWGCCNCNWPNMSYNYDSSCHGCGHRRDPTCHVWSP